MNYLIECPFCKAVVSADEKVRVKDSDLDEGYPFDDFVSLCQCPGCSSVIIGVQSEDPDGILHSPRRVWPKPPQYISYQIPTEIRLSLTEAEKCLKAQAFIACIAMCGRALEAVGRHFYSKATTQKAPLMLKAAIDKLAADKIIDGRLHSWGLALHADRNLAAHPSGTVFKEQDAQDLFKFAVNICEYVFVLTADFEAFEKRRKSRDQKNLPKTQKDSKEP